ncbi:DMT family transporter [Thalassospira sp. HF15]|uniref:DMT family transporter n=1 Tax=Thalassospira sp. HF15 TaxID=2722755 RepID=UPI0020CA48AC|nr:DMT family transporter [Thalassospira sp. HF15]
MKNKSYIVFGLLALLWGLTFLFNKGASTLISPMQIASVRVFMGFLPVFAAALIGRKLKWQHLRYAHHFIAMSILAGSLYYFSFAKGIQLLPSSLAGMLSGAIPMISFVTAAVFLRNEPINRRSVLGLCVGFAGIAMIARPWDASISTNDLAGFGFIGLGSLCVGLSFVYARRFISPLGISPLALCTYQLGIAAVTFLFIADFDGALAIFDNGWIALGLFFGLGLFGTGIAYLCYYLVVENLGAVKAASVTYIPPIIAVLTGSLILGENVQLQELIAMAAILTGVIVMQSGRTPAMQNQLTAAPSRQI